MGALDISRITRRGYVLDSHSIRDWITGDTAPMVELHQDVDLPPALRDIIIVETLRHRTPQRLFIHIKAHAYSLH
ncbi:hypothetical protein KIN20_007018 [Parelaphostrongylus tenuis]|uniref:Uncharacterized protein n=1 Tax=Parelaphostrongylus tenuis TaxID=148309 RepID=A0AAD5M2P5_PARTN|nr:hypothetical protein KIN20_007018 [Parelaphostrongylus tenuis]